MIQSSDATRISRQLHTSCTTDAMDAIHYDILKRSLSGRSFLYVSQITRENIQKLEEAGYNVDVLQHRGAKESADYDSFIEVIVSWDVEQFIHNRMKEYAQRA